MLRNCHSSVREERIFYNSHTMCIIQIYMHIVYLKWFMRRQIHSVEACEYAKRVFHRFGSYDEVRILEWEAQRIRRVFI